MTARGCFITLEGLDGAGKSTHLPWIEQTLRAAGIDLLRTREPGGTPLGEALRELLLHQDMEAGTEALLMFAARNEHWHTRIQPALTRGQWVLCDRYADASYAYQGGGRQLGSARVQILDDWVQQGQGPDCTILFDIPLEVARERLAHARQQADRFEQEDAAFFERTRQAYLGRVAQAPDRFHVVDARRAVDDVRADLAEFVQGLLRRHAHGGGTS